MLRFVAKLYANVTGISDPGPLAGKPGTSPPNMSPLYSEIGTIAAERVFQKCLVIYTNNVPCVEASTMIYQKAT